MKFGIIGLGNHAINRVMPAIADAGHQISSVYSRNIEKARKEGLKYGSSAYDDLEKMLKNSDMDAVYIASPNFLHYEQAKASLLNGKHVLLEKQMTLRNEEAEEIVKLADKENLTLAVGFHMRFHPAAYDVRQILKKGELGEIARITGTWAGLSKGPSVNPDEKWWREDDKVGGGSVMGTGVHVIDTLNFLLGRIPDRVTAFRKPSDRVIETTEQVNMDYGDIVSTAFSSRAILNPMNNLEIYGSKGNAVVQGMFSTKIEAALFRDGKKIKDYRGIDMYREEVKAFFKAVKGEESIIARGIDGYYVVKIVNAASRADARGTIEKL